MRLFLLAAVVALVGCKKDNTTGHDDQLSFQFNMEQWSVAEHFAPIVFQETGAKPEYDALTHFDFDGDYVGDNNWENAPQFEKPAFVYFSVVETDSHFYIFYGFYHARDYEISCVPILCHENDFEGAMLTVRKTFDSNIGEVEFVETQAHDHFYSYKPYMIRGEGVPGAHDRVALFIEKQGHGVYSLEGHDSVLEQVCGSNGNTFDRGKNRKLEDTNEDHLIYQYRDYAEDTGGAKEGEFSYALIPMTDFWNKLSDKQQYGQLFNFPFDYKGARFRGGKVPMAFFSKKYTLGEFGTAKFPWGWVDNRCKKIKKGDWFFDPAYSIKTRLGLEVELSADYEFNPYL